MNEFPADDAVELLWDVRVGIFALLRLQRAGLARTDYGCLLGLLRGSVCNYGVISKADELPRRNAPQPNNFAKRIGEFV